MSAGPSGGAMTFELKSVACFLGYLVDHDPFSVSFVGALESVVHFKSVKSFFFFKEKIVFFF